MPENRIGWIFLLTGLANSVQLLSWQYADVGLHAIHRLPGARGGPVFNTVIGEATAGLLGLSLLLFPDGRLPSRRWRPALASLVLGMLLFVLAGTLRPGRYAEPFAEVSNPFGLPGARGVMDAVDLAGWLLVVAGIGLGAAAMVVRLRRCAWPRASAAQARARGGLDRRDRGRVGPGDVVHLAGRDICRPGSPWLASALRAFRLSPESRSSATACTRSTSSSTARLSTARSPSSWRRRSRRRSCCSGRRSGGGQAGRLPRATLVVAVAFRPLRARVQDAVDRRFNRARYDALRRMAGFLEDLRAGRAAPEEVEGVLRSVLSDPRLELLFFLPESELYVDARGMAVADLPDDGRERIPVERAASRSGWCSTIARAKKIPTMLGRVVEAGGLAIEIARLRVELRRQLAEVEASRARIVAAGNDERRRIERDLHDGAQQRLVSIGLTLRHAQHELGSASPGAPGQTLDGAVAEVAVAIDELRELARGLPPSQLDAGLAPAFRELARRAPIPVEVEAPGERFGRDVEAAAYFIGCEGLTNAVKHAHATKILLSAGAARPAARRLHRRRRRRRRDRRARVGLARALRPRSPPSAAPCGSRAPPAPARR